jgi:hypothetical protein
MTRGAGAYTIMHFIFLDLRKKMQVLQKTKHEREQVQVHDVFLSGKISACLALGYKNKFSL